MFSGKQDNHMNRLAIGKSMLALAAVGLALHPLLTARAAEKAAPAAGTAPSPRIGLTLSGGGARGLAHIGVLKVLEELRVPVHCIVGTSMGSIVGGAYASGAQPAALERTVVETDWDAVFSDRPPREEISSRRKQDEYKTLFAPEYGVKDGGLVLPKGIIAGVSIEAYFRALTESAVGITNFQQLPIPFQAVATDIETGEAVVLDRGSLAQAMRASMAIPGAIAPVEVEGRLLVDGGISNNLPIDQTRKLCADVVIAVNISTPPLKRSEITSVLSVTGQLINLLGLANVDRQLKSLGERDVLINPELGDITSGSFDRSRDAIRIGEEAARKMAESLRRYSLPEKQYSVLRQRQIVERAERKGLGTVDEIRFEGLKRTNPEVLRELVRSEPGEVLTEEKVGKDLRRIYGRGDFESIDYRIVEEAGKRVMVIQPQEKSWGPDYLRFGLGIATDFQGETNVSVLASHRQTWLNRLGGEWLNELKIGTNNSFFTEFYQPVHERGVWFVAPNAFIGQNVRSVFVDNDRVARYDVNEGRVGLDGGAALGTWGEARVGYLWRKIHAKVETGTPLLPKLEEDSAGVRARLSVDQLDHPWFPRRGYQADLSYYVADESLGSTRDYKRLEGTLGAAVSWGVHNFQVAAAGGTDLNTDMPAYETFTLGGPLRLSGYHIDEFSGRRMAFGRLIYYNHAVKLPSILGTGLYVGGSLEAGRVTRGLSNVGVPDPGTLLSASVFIAADSFLGPGYLGLGFGENGRMSLYLLLGIP
jgi:NTE family protein